MNENASTFVKFRFFLHCNIFSMPRISNNLRERTIGMLDAGMSTERAARHVGCSSRAIRNLRIRFRTTGSTDDLPRRGRPRVTTRGQDRYIINTHLRNRFQTATLGQNISQFLLTYGHDFCTKRCIIEHSLNANITVIPPVSFH